MTRAQALIDKHILIDFSNDTFMHLLKHNLNLNGIGSVLMTHSHADHLCVDEFENRRYGMAHNPSYEKLDFYGSSVCLDIMINAVLQRNILDEEGLHKYYNFIEVKSYEKFNIEDYYITPLPAVHVTTEQAYIYLIEHKGKCILYGNDTGVFGSETDEYLSTQGKHIDLLSLDCTKGDNDFKYYTHMSMEEGKTIAERFEKLGIIDDKTLKYYTHFSHNCGMIYDELVKSAQKYDFNVAHDGLIINL